MYNVTKTLSSYYNFRFAYDNQKLLTQLAELSEKEYVGLYYIL